MTHRHAALRAVALVAAAASTLTVLVASPPAPARAAAAGLDASYAAGGRAGAGFTDVVGIDAVTDAAGRRTVLGQQGTPERPTGTVWLARFTAAGAVDAGFGTAGRLSVVVPTGTRVAHLDQDGDGTLWITGTTARTVVVVRLSAAGVPDPTFGTDGVTTYDSALPAGYSLRVGAVTLAGGGGLAFTATGFTEAGDDQLFAAMVVRLTAAGAPDPSFGSNGRATLPNGLATTAWELSGIAQLASGKTAVGFGINAAGVEDRGVFRLEPDGTPDTGFGAGGVSRALADESLGYHGVGDLLEGPDGTLLVAGYASAGFFLARLQVDGERDTAFGAAGLSIAPGGGCTADGAELAVDSKARYWVSHTQGCGISGAQFARFLPSGMPDPSFGDGGLLGLHYDDVTPAAADPYDMGARSLWFDEFDRPVFGVGSTTYRDSDEVSDLVSWRLTADGAVVTVAPGVATHPVTRTGLLNRTVSFTARGSGVPAPTVAWQVSTNGGVGWTTVPGATANTLTVTANPSTNRRLYRAVFSNAAGTVTSAAAMLRLRPTRGDFTGDARTDLAVYRPRTGAWYVRGRATVAYGLIGDVPVASDYNGDGRTDIAVYRPSTGTWFVQGQFMVAYGARGDVPLTGDFNGDGRTDIAVYRPSTGGWYIRGQATVTWGARGDLPVPGDFNGDGRTDIAVYRPSTGGWYIRGQATVTWGARGDLPVPGDFNGDGRTDIAVYRPSTGGWLLRGQATVRYGSPGDIPLNGDFTGDGRTEIAVYRPGTGRWYVRGLPAVTYGVRGDLPVPR